jgi:hypothetical protein
MIKTYIWFCIPLLVLACKGLKKEPTIVKQVDSVRPLVLDKTLPTLLKIMENDENKILKEGDTIITNLLSDSTISIKDKFNRIYYERLLTDGNMSMFFLDASTLHKYQSHYLKKKNGLIEYYSNLKDSIKAGKTDLDSNSIQLFSGDTSYLAFTYKNGKRDTIRWVTKDEGDYGFAGYYSDIGYYWLQQSFPPTNDYYINSFNGDVLDFLPNFSKDRSCYCYLGDQIGYGDEQFLEFIIGKDLMHPLRYLISTYYPLIYGSKNYSKFGFNNIIWISKNQLVFEFYHLINKDTGNNDTLYYKQIGVQINVN